MPIRRISGYELFIQLTNDEHLTVPYCVDFDDESSTDKMLIVFDGTLKNDELVVYKANIVYYTVQFIYQDEVEEQ